MQVNIPEKEEPIFTEQYATKRATVPSLEEVLGKPFPALNHGFIRVVDYMGNDAAIVQAARVSYGAGTKKVNEDKGLIRYLYRHAHTTPFEMCEIKLHCKMPIFVARQWIRHRTANVNEYSARYSILDKEFYVPDESQLCEQSLTNKQGRGDGSVDQMQAARILDLLKADANQAYDNYQDMLNENPDEPGKPLDPEKPMLARELARMNLNLSFYTQWYWKIDLHNLLRFLSLRCDAHAQYEIRVFADIILNEVVKRWVPMAYQAFVDYDHRQGGGMFSRMELDYMKAMFQAMTDIGLNSDEYITKTLTEKGASKREAEEFIKKMRSEYDKIK